MATNVKDLEHKQEKLAETRIHLFNPDTKDFTVNFHGQPVTIHSQEIEEFDYITGQHIKKHLAVHLMNQKKIARPKKEDWNRLYKQIVVEI